MLPLMPSPPFVEQQGGYASFCGFWFGGFARHKDPAGIVCRKAAYSFSTYVDAAVVFNASHVGYEFSANRDSAEQFNQSHTGQEFNPHRDAIGSECQ